MAVKSYADKITTNWNELTPERQSEIKAIWNEYRAGYFIRQIESCPKELQQPLFDEVMKQLSTA